MSGMINFLEYFFHIFFQTTFLKTILFILTLMINKTFMFYLDSVLTRGLLMSALEKHAYAVCPWDLNNHECIEQSDKLALVDHRNQIVTLIPLLPKTECIMRSFSPKEHQLILNLGQHAVVNGTLTLRHMISEITVKISVVGSLKIQQRFIHQPFFRF